MAQGQLRRQAAKRLVECGRCRHFQRDTEGLSRRQETGEYFMGVCLLGLTPDTRVKQFADKARECEKWAAR